MAIPKQNPAPDQYDPPTIKASLESRKAVLETQIAEINGALAAFEKYPEVGTLLDLLDKWRSGRY